MRLATCSRLWPSPFPESGKVAQLHVSRSATLALAILGFSQEVAKRPPFSFPLHGSRLERSAAVPASVCFCFSETGDSVVTGAEPCFWESDRLPSGHLFSLWTKGLLLSVPFVGQQSVQICLACKSVICSHVLFVDLVVLLSCCCYILELMFLPWHLLPNSTMV